MARKRKSLGQAPAYVSCDAAARRAMRAVRRGDCIGAQQLVEHFESCLRAPAKSAQGKQRRAFIEKVRVEVNKACRRPGLGLWRARRPGRW